ncbi:hypothetical protein B0H11DRAFT_1990392 [Mycena galericulata]|nr:hypothetical protein B0H11DRAFT_1990392 [Mycena galericulata]
MTKLQTSEPNTTKPSWILSTTPQSPPSKKRLREARDEARPRAVLSECPTMIQPRVCEVGYGGFHKSSEVRLETTDLGKNPKEHKLVRWEKVQYILAFVVLVGRMRTPRNFRNRRAGEKAPWVLACTYEGEAGLDWAIYRFTRQGSWQRWAIRWDKFVGIPREPHGTWQDEDRNGVVGWRMSYEGVDRD